MTPGGLVPGQGRKKPPAALSPSQHWGRTKASWDQKPVRAQEGDEKVANYYFAKVGIQGTWPSGLLTQKSPSNTEPGLNPSQLYFLPDETVYPSCSEPAAASFLPFPRAMHAPPVRLPDKPP